MVGHHEEAKQHNEEAEKHHQEVRRLWDLARDDFQAALKINPVYDFGNNNLGVYYANLGKTDLAENIFYGPCTPNRPTPTPSATYAASTCE